MVPGDRIPQNEGIKTPEELAADYYKAVAYGLHEHRVKRALQKSVREHQAACARIRAKGL